MLLGNKHVSMASDIKQPKELPDSIAELLEQHDPETLLAIREYADSILDEYDIEEEIGERTYG